MAEQPAPWSETHPEGSPAVPSVAAPDPREELWRGVLNGTWPQERERWIFRRLPSSPRCKACAAPFKGPGRPIMAMLGRSPWPKNPKYCAVCFNQLRAVHGGAEVECSLLFADVRGSTTMAERMRPADFTRLMGRFYDTATDVLVAHDAIVDKFVGDEVIGIFIPALAGSVHAERAIEAAQALLRRTGHSDAAGPWVPIGAGVNTGIAYVGAIGEGLDTELTAMGDAVNTTARLASAAGAGEILVTANAMAAARGGVGGAGGDVADGERARGGAGGGEAGGDGRGGNTGGGEDELERRSLELKGKTAPTDVYVLKVTPSEGR